jgi:hypothetical protein
MTEETLRQDAAVGPPHVIVPWGARFEHRAKTTTQPDGWITCVTRRPAAPGTTPCACGRYQLVWQ